MLVMEPLTPPICDFHEPQTLLMCASKTEENFPKYNFFFNKMTRVEDLKYWTIVSLVSYFFS